MTGAKVIVLSDAEYEAAIESTLARLGYTREDLARQAAERDFESPTAFMMWHTIRADMEGERVASQGNIDRQRAERRAAAEAEKATPPAWDCYEPDELGGVNGFIVGLKGDSDYPDEIEWVAQLPHQCGPWEIGQGSDRAAVIADLEKFIAEAQVALARLRTMPDPRG